MTEWDCAADWTGQLTRYDITIMGKVDFGAFDFTAAKLVVKLQPLSALSAPWSS